MNDFKLSKIRNYVWGVLLLSIMLVIGGISRTPEPEAIGGIFVLWFWAFPVVINFIGSVFEPGPGIQHSFLNALISCVPGIGFGWMLDNQHWWYDDK